MDFEAQVAPYRGDLLALCYRMLGSVHDAEDVLQETLLRAWRSFDTYDASRASLRTWLHRIATNACLTALAGRAKRPLPSGLGAPDDDPERAFAPGIEVPWLEPFPTAAHDESAAQSAQDPAAITARRDSLRLAFVAALQLLPARQRAVLILRDVLAWSAAETADLLEMTPIAVNSALQRAHKRLDQEGVAEDGLAEPTVAEQRVLLDKYVDAFLKADLEALQKLLADDAIMEMPPMLGWYVGSDLYAAFMARVFRLRGTDWRFVQTSANGQPALAAYNRLDAADPYQAHTLQVFEAAYNDAGQPVFRRNSVFQLPGLFEAFGLPDRLEP